MNRIYTKEPVRIDIRFRDKTAPVLVGRGILHSFGDYVAPYTSSRDVALVADATVAKLYRSELIESLSNAGLITRELSLNLNNASKTLATVERVYDFLAEERANWSTLVILLGGNVLIDSAGFAAATFNRGLRYVTLPTTLLSQVDGGIGGALGVHFKDLTNYVGTRQLPEMVYCDVDTLGSLPPAELRAGFAEIVKQCCVADSTMLDELFRLDPAIMPNGEILQSLVLRTVTRKAVLVETGDDSFLNFGHTVGHALENLMRHSGIRHGEAVSIGMCAEARLAERSGMLPSGSSDRLEELLRRFGLPVHLPHELVAAHESADSLISDLWEMVWRDKKVFDGVLNWVVPSPRFGSASRATFSRDQFDQVLLTLFDSSDGDGLL